MIDINKFNQLPNNEHKEFAEPSRDSNLKNEFLQKYLEKYKEINKNVLYLKQINIFSKRKEIYFDAKIQTDRQIAI